MPRGPIPLWPAPHLRVPIYLSHVFLTQTVPSLSTLPLPSTHPPWLSALQLRHMTSFSPCVTTHCRAHATCSSGDPGGAISSGQLPP